MMDWSNVSEDIAKFYNLYSELMEFWKSKIPNFIHDVNYYSLVQNKEKEIFVKFIDQPILIDGDLSENIWEEAFRAADFQQYFPSDSILAKQKTSIKMLYDQVNLYLGVKVYTSGNDFIIPSLQRDFRAGNNDNISFIFDTFNY